MAAPTAATDTVTRLIFGTEDLMNDICARLLKSGHDMNQRLDHDGIGPGVSLLDVSRELLHSLHMCWDDMLVDGEADTLSTSTVSPARLTASFSSSFNPSSQVRFLFLCGESALKCLYFSSCEDQKRGEPTHPCNSGSHRPHPCQRQSVPQRCMF